MAENRQLVTMLEATNLSKSFGTLQAVKGVSVSVGGGESYALLGPDGAGKTTLIRLLCGLLKADGGTSVIGGRDAFAEPEAARALIGYMPQQFSLYPTLSIDENIRFFARVYGVYTKHDPFVEELLESSRLTPFRKRLAARLSGGMKQKLALICAVLHRPKLLFLDEPTTGVDPVSRRDFWAILYRLLSEGMTLLISTPYMDEAERCRRVGLLSDGTLIAEAAPAELKKGVDAEVWEIECSQPPRASRVLKAMEGVLGAQVFTDRLRVLASEFDPALCRESLTREGFVVNAMTQTPPSMEDVFIHSVLRQKNR